MKLHLLATAALITAGLTTTSNAQALSGHNCPGSGFKSYSSNAQYMMTVVNQSAEPVSVYWSDFDGNSVFYKTLNPGQSYNQSTYSSHGWLFWQGNRCEYQFMMPSADQTVTIR